MVNMGDFFYCESARAAVHLAYLRICLHLTSSSFFIKLVAMALCSQIRSKMGKASKLMQPMVSHATYEDKKGGREVANSRVDHSDPSKMEDTLS